MRTPDSYFARAAFRAALAAVREAIVGLGEVEGGGWRGSWGGDGGGGGGGGGGGDGGDLYVSSKGCYEGYVLILERGGGEWW